MDRLKVLVIDDEPGIRMAINRSLQNYVMQLPDLGSTFAFDVIEAGTGEEGLECLMSQKPDILLLDYKLPGISGLDVLKSIVDNKIDVLTIMITAYASLDTAILATKRGAYDFLAKPFTPTELKSALYKAGKHLMIQREAAKLAAERKQVRFELLSVVAHELKAPTSAIEGYLMMMRDRVLGDDLSKYDHSIERATIRLHGMRKLISDLLDLTRIESGRKQRNLDSYDVMAIAAKAVESGNELAPDKNVTVKLADGDPIFMTCDANEIELILNNLISNAIKYNKDNGQVFVELHEFKSSDAHTITMAVRDTGIGMTEKEQERLFGEFSRIKNEKTRQIEGSGLGLAIVKKLVDQYYGVITVNSVPDEGTTFTITFKFPTSF